MRTLVIGDIHGAHKALIQVLERASFAPSSDRIIFLGDVADGWPEVPEVFEFILGLDNYGYVMGNHDYWLYEYLKFGDTKPLWTNQGGQSTLDAYLNYANPAMEMRHLEFLESAPYYIEENGNLFVHGGFATAWLIENQDPIELMWDRDLWWHAKLAHAKEEVVSDKYEKIFIGHTTTSRERKDLTPVKASNVWNLDQGVGWEGKLTCMDIETEEYWQSDIVSELYPNIKGR